MASTRKGGVGLNLTAAFRLVLFEPDYKRGTEEQAFSRVRRVSQKMHCVYYYRLYSDPDIITVDDIVMKRQDRASELTIDVFEPPRAAKSLRTETITISSGEGSSSDSNSE